MKKENMGLVFYIMFFSFSLIVEIYSLLEWRKDIVSIIGTSVVFLVALYLLLDSIKVEIKKLKDEYFTKTVTNQESENNDLNAVNGYKLQQIEKLIDNQTERIEQSVNEKLAETRSELTKRQKNCVEVIIKAQKSFTEAIIRNGNGHK